tara:strand:- start:703 stop:1308 length:606 start_codon:yes stop_codon:yes gene_type:complete
MLKKIVCIFAVSLLFILIQFQPINSINAAEDPGEYINGITNSAIKSLTDGNSDAASKEKQFGDLFDENFDIPSISRFVLGKYWKQASKDQKKEFRTAFRNYVVKSYSSRFTDYAGEQLKLVNYENEKNPKLFIVHTILERKDAPLIKVDWRVGKKKDKYVVLDIIIEGISLAVTQRAEFVSFIDQNEGNINKLISLLNEKS